LLEQKIKELNKKGDWMKEYNVELYTHRTYPSPFDVGYTYKPSVEIPKEVIKELGWKKETKLRLRFDEENRKLIIEEDTKTIGWRKEERMEKIVFCSEKRVKFDGIGS